MVRRHAPLALLAFLAGVGCHAGTSGNMARQDPPLSKNTVTVTKFIAQHNRNAQAVRSLQAAPRIEAIVDGRRYRVNGQMAMERPKNFKLELKATMGKVADIGSNDQGFWFWVKDNKEKAIYVCDHDHVNASPLAITLQPDWIIEAMGLREIPKREADTISAKPGDTPGTLLLTQFRKDAKGDTLTKETVVNETNGHILEHRLYSGAKKELLARATVSQYLRKEMASTEPDSSETIVELPEKFRLDWLVEKFTLDVTMGNDDTVRINPQFAEDRKVALFTEPTISGTTRLNLAQLGGAPTATSSRVHETMPIPRSGVRLGQPEAVPMGVEGAIQSRRTPSLVPDDPAGTTPSSLGVVGPLVPTGSDPEAVQAAASQSWRRRPALEQ